MAPGVGAFGVEGYGSCCPGCGPIMPPCEEGNCLGVVGGGCWSGVPSRAEPKSILHLGHFVPPGGISVLQWGQNVAPQLLQYFWPGSICIPQLGQYLCCCTRVPSVDCFDAQI
jgi:hypothetical protein